MQHGGEVAHYGKEMFDGGKGMAGLAKDGYKNVVKPAMSLQDLGLM